MILRSIFKVHRTRLGFAILGVSVIVAVLSGSLTLSRLGFNYLSVPVSPALLLAIPAGLGVVIALSGLEHVQRPRNLRRFLSDVLHLMLVVCFGLSVYWVTVHGRGFEYVSDLAIIRNFFIVIGLGLPWVTFGRTEHAWLMPFIVTLFATQFGRSADGVSYPWWASIIDPFGTVSQLLWAFLLFMSATVLHIADPRFASRKNAHGLLN